MSDNWVIQNLENALSTWDSKLSEIWTLLTQNITEFKDGALWEIVLDIHWTLQSVGLALVVLFFLCGVVKTCGSLAELKRPEVAVKMLVRFCLAKALVTYGLEIMMALLNIVQGMAEIKDYLDLGERMHRGLVKPADYARNLADNGQVSSTEYASDQLQYVAEDLSYEAGHIAVDMAKSTFRSTRRVHKHIQEHRKVDDLPKTQPRAVNIGSAPKADAAVRQAAQTTGKAAVKTAQKTIKDSQQTVKASQEATKASIKTAQETARAAEKTARAAAATARKTGELLRDAAKAAAEAAKAATKAIAAAAKAVAATVEEIAEAIAAGGWVALVIIAVIIIIFVITMAVIYYWETTFPLKDIVTPNVLFQSVFQHIY